MKLRPEVAAFAQLMEGRLRDNDHKPGWKHAPPDELFVRLIEEAGELGRATWQPQFRSTIAAEAADVANFALMIADIFGGLKEEPDA